MNIDASIGEEFSRNIGLLSVAEQQKLLGSRVAVAGAGGVGGLHVITLARLGIGKFTIADPDTFEPVNINRQFGATTATMGKNKAEVLAQMVKEINPRAEVKLFTEGVHADNLESFLDNVTVFVDGIDFFEIEIRRMIFKRSREQGIYAITSAPLGFGATLQVFAPQGMGFDEYFGISDNMTYMEKIAAFASGLAPHPYHIKYLDMTKVSLKKRTGPAVSLACTLAASLVASEVIKIITGKGRLKPAPHYVQIDLLLGKFRQGYLWRGGKNPMQRLKKSIILKKARSAQ